MKSHASYLLEVATCILKDAVAKCTAVKFDTRDLLTIKSRFEHEGLSFLTITLPDFGKDFDSCLSKERIDPCDFRSYRKVGRIPAFLQGIVGQVFDQTTGALHENPSIEAIEGVRQIVYVFKKLEVACNSKRVAAAIGGFQQCERQLGVAIDPDSEDYFLRVSQCLWSGVFDTVAWYLTVPKHGPGATQERISGNQKYVHRRWHERLEPYFPLLGTALSERAAFSEEFQNVTFVREADEKPVRVITVPKTLKTPRVIAVEPVCMQYTQQALARSIVSILERARISRGHVNFRDQSVNRRLAMDGSKTGGLATLDLSSASDLVPYSLAIRMFDSNPFLKGAISACRSTHARLPTGEALKLEKFASMGSALCFPVESMYFYTICVGALLRKAGQPVTARSVYNASRRVFVYGDDLIVPADAAVAVAGELAKFHSKVNASKSHWTGKFRESCGMDAYAGEEVTPTYLRQVAPRDRRSAKSIISWVETSNHFYKRGYWLTSSYLKNQIEAITGSLPVVGERCPGLGWSTFQDFSGLHKVQGRYQRPEVWTWVPKPVYRPDRLGGWSALQKCLLSLHARASNEMVLESSHLLRTARAHAVTLKRGRVPVA